MSDQDQPLEFKKEVQTSLIEQVTKASQIIAEAKVNAFDNLDILVEETENGNDREKLRRRAEKATQNGQESMEILENLVLYEEREELGSILEEVKGSVDIINIENIPKLDELAEGIKTDISTISGRKSKEDEESLNINTALKKANTLFENGKFEEGKAVLKQTLELIDNISSFGTSRRISTIRGKTLTAHKEEALLLSEKMHNQSLKVSSLYDQLYKDDVDYNSLNSVRNALAVMRDEGIGLLSESESEINTILNEESLIIGESDAYYKKIRDALNAIIEKIPVDTL